MAQRSNEKALGMPNSEFDRNQTTMVALLTFHNALNHGAALQVFASQQALHNMNVDCEIIDYVNEHRDGAYSMGRHAIREIRGRHLSAALKYCAGSLFMRRRRQKFEVFYDVYLRLTRTCYASSEEAESLNGKFDRFVVGSDQVWNPRHNGMDFAYLLDFVHDNNKKIAYSSSFGLATIPEDLQNRYAELLKRIKYISTRESYGIQLIRDLTGREAELVLDPVFLLDKKQWLSLCGDIQKKERYVFCNTNRPTQWRDFLTQTNYSTKRIHIFKMTRHLTIKDFLDRSVKVIYSISPIEFIETIACAELVVTASFHCIAMSVILNVPFIAVLTGDQGKDERVLNILRITGLENRILNDSMTLDDVNKPIDFTQVEAKVAEYRKKSMDFLKNAIASG